MGLSSCFCLFYLFFSCLCYLSILWDNENSSFLSRGRRRGERKSILKSCLWLNSKIVFSFIFCFLLRNLRDICKGKGRTKHEFVKEYVRATRQRVIGQWESDMMTLVIIDLTLTDAWNMRCNIWPPVKAPNDFILATIYLKPRFIELFRFQIRIINYLCRCVTMIDRVFLKSVYHKFAGKKQEEMRQPSRKMKICY